MKKILARQLILKKYSYYDLKRIHSRNLIAKKIPAARKFPFTSNPTPPPPPPHNFSNGPSLSKLGLPAIND